MLRCSTVAFSTLTQLYVKAFDGGSISLMSTLLQRDHCTRVALEDAVARRSLSMHPYLDVAK